MKESFNLWSSSTTNVNRVEEINSETRYHFGSLPKFSNFRLLSIEEKSYVLALLSSQFPLTIDEILKRSEEQLNCCDSNESFEQLCLDYIFLRGFILFEDKWYDMYANANHAH